MAGGGKRSNPFPGKCAECICGIENNRGIWCARLRKVPTAREVRQCRRFCSKALLEKSKGDAKQKVIH